MHAWRWHQELPAQPACGVCCVNEAGEECRDSRLPWAAAGTEAPCPGSCTQTGPAKCHFLPGSMPSNSAPPPVASERPFSSHYINCAPATWPRAGASHASLMRKADGLKAPLHILPGKFFCLFREYPPEQEDELIQTQHHHLSNRERNTRHIYCINKWVCAESYKVAQ